LINLKEREKSGDLDVGNIKIADLKEVEYEKVHCLIWHMNTIRNLRVP
jgi:hypothetical protein